MKLPPGYVAGRGVVQGTAYGGFGERMLQSLGWERGKGLGKDEQGMKDAIEVKKKDDTIGVGGGPSTNWKDAWWEDAFNSAVKNLGRTNSSSSDSDDTDSEDDLDDGLRRNRDGTMASASAQELKILEALNKSQGRVSTGRFGGRDAKMERIRRQEALEAAQLAERMGVSIDTGVKTGGDEEKLPKNKKTKKEINSSSSTRIVIECAGKGSEISDAVMVPTPKDGWWGCKLFCSAGSMSGAALELPVQDKNGKGFSESQQASIYEQAQSGKTIGKTGLGKGKRGTIKIDGMVWEGKKTTFPEDGEDVEKTRKTKKKKESPTPGDNEFRKWKKVVLKVLKKKAKPNKGMKVKSLHSSVGKMLASEYKLELEKDQIRDQIQRTIVDHSDMFCVSGDYISLCS